MEEIYRVRMVVNYLVLKKSFIKNNNMNIVFIGAGGLLNFDATLPILALSISLYVLILTHTVYGPLAKESEVRKEDLERRKKFLYRKAKHLEEKLKSLSDEG
jgi:hypothetical protein